MHSIKSQLNRKVLYVIIIFGAIICFYFLLVFIPTSTSFQTTNFSNEISQTPPQVICSSKLANDFTKNFKNAPVCPYIGWFQSLQSLDPSSNKLIINIGANKGWNIVSFLELWQPHRAVSKDSWKTRLEERGFKKTEKCATCNACGVCSDCRECPFVSLSTNSWESSSSFNFQIFAFEPVKSTSTALKQVINDLQLQDIVIIEQLAFSDREYEGNFIDEETPGNELGSITNNPKATKVQITSVDIYNERIWKNRKIDVLEIDTEGYDPLVLKGAVNVLKSNLVRLLIFEYHHLAEWKNTELLDVVSKLDKFGYDCYFMNTKQRPLIRITGCWVSVFEFHNWSNVACILRSDILWSTAMQSIAFANVE